MARFKLTQAVALPRNRYFAGQIVAQPGDQIWVGLTSQTMVGGMQPLDASATTMKNASIYAGEPTVTSITGVDSINA
jgi:hypothetical protein